VQITMFISHDVNCARIKGKVAVAFAQRAIQHDKQVGVVFFDPHVRKTTTFEICARNRECQA
jgi:hypothetical protein